MKFSIEEAARLAAIGLFSSMIVACGSDNKSSGGGDGDGDEHDHGALIVSQKDSTEIAVFHEDEGEFDALDGAFSLTAPSFVRSDNGEFAASYVAGGSVIEFIGEDGLLASETGSQVVATNGHFSILEGSSSKLIEVEALETDPENLASEAIEPSVAEVYPALVLDEAEELVMVFVSGEARLYEGATQVVGDTIDCTDPTSTAQAHHAVMMTCDDGVYLVQFEDDPSISYTVTAQLDVTGDSDSEKAYVWSSTEHVFAGYAPGTKDYDIIHIEDNGDVDNIDTTADGAVVLNDNICVASIEAGDGDLLFWLEGGNFAAADSDAQSVIGTTGNISISSSDSEDCSSYHMAVTAKVALVLDEVKNKFYELDVEEDEGATDYHLHITVDTSDVDLEDTVALFHNEGGSHTHSDEE